MKVLKNFRVDFLKACSKMEGSSIVLYLSLQIQQKVKPCKPFCM